VDATLGGGGHAFEILRRTGPDGRVVGIEWDEEAIAESRKVLGPFGPRVTIIRDNFVRFPERLREMKIEAVDGILFDLGLSSIQLEGEERGFSFMGEGPLDMRMDQRSEATAEDLVNQLSQGELEEVLRVYGEERWSKRISEAIVKERSQGPVKTTKALRKIVCQAVPRRFQSRRIDPATRTFQALRIEVNQELENLRGVLENGWPLLKKGGRMCVISFHSLEDRTVKEAFRRLAGREAGGSGHGHETAVKIITPKPITPSEEEQSRNPRSRSAKLRCAERV